MRPFIAAAALAAAAANRNVPLTDGAPDMATARIIDYDNARFGASAERRRLLARWNREVGALPR